MHNALIASIFGVISLPFQPGRAEASHLGCRTRSSARSPPEAIFT